MVHGLTARTVVIPSEDPAEYARHGCGRRHFVSAQRGRGYAGFLPGNAYAEIRSDLGRIEFKHFLKRVRAT